MRLLFNIIGEPKRWKLINTPLLMGTDSNRSTMGSVSGQASASVSGSKGKPRHGFVIQTKPGL